MYMYYYTISEIPFLIVGTKMDLFDQEKKEEDWRVSTDEARYHTAIELGAYKYMECTAKGLCLIELQNVITQAEHSAECEKWKRRRTGCPISPVIKFRSEIS